MFNSDIIACRRYCVRCSTVNVCVCNCELNVKQSLTHSIQLGLGLRCSIQLS